MIYGHKSEGKSQQKQNLNYNLTQEGVNNFIARTVILPRNQNLSDNH